MWNEFERMNTMKHDESHNSSIWHRQLSGKNFCWKHTETLGAFSDLQSIPFVIFCSIHIHNGGFLNPSFTNNIHQILGVHLSTNCTVSSTNSLLDAYQISGQSVRLFWKYQSPCESEVWSHAMKLHKFNNQQWVWETEFDLQCYIPNSRFIGNLNKTNSNHFKATISQQISWNEHNFQLQQTYLRQISRKSMTTRDDEAACDPETWFSLDRGN